MPARARLEGRLIAMATRELLTDSVEETRRIGAWLGELARPGDVFLLQGGLGAGKTALTQGIAAGLGVREVPSSPTFTLVNEYRGRLPLYHIDLYRLEREVEIEQLGLEEYLFDEGVTVVEWPERDWAVWPRERLVVRLEYVGPTRRRLRLEPVGERYEELVKEVLHRAKG